MSVNHFLHFGLRDHSDLGRHDFATFENHQSRQHGDTVFDSQRAVFVHVNFDDTSLAFVCIRQLIDNWTQFATRASRRSPKVDKHRLVMLDDLGLKCVFVYFCGHIFTSVCGLSALCAKHRILAAAKVRSKSLLLIERTAPTSRPVH